MTPEDTLQRTQWDFFWVPEDVVVIDRPELLYVHGPYPLPHLNMVTRLDATSENLEDLLDEVQAAHADRPSCFQVLHRPEYRRLERALSRRGYTETHRHEALVLRVSDWDRPFPADLDVHRVLVRGQMLDWHRVAHAAFDTDSVISDARIARDLAQCTGEGARVHRFVACDAETGRPLAAAGMTAFSDLGFGFLWAGGTVPDGRLKGAYTSVLTARIRCAQQLGLSAVGVYGLLDTSAPILRRLGFVRHGGMSFWSRPP